jgi:predicted TIM-barrel fold metal-dependent hydrolase
MLSESVRVPRGQIEHDTAIDRFRPTVERGSSMEFVRSDEVARIRNRLDHPVIDGDGHLIEYTPIVRDFVREIAGEEVAQRFDGMVQGSVLARQVPREAKRGLGMTRFAWWGVPTRNTLDRATAMLPKLMYSRLDELGIDFAMLYPTYGLTVTAFPDEELRRAMARAFNRYYAECYGEYRDRLEPVAAIPMFTPEEAIEELDHAIVELGLKSVMLSGVIPRAVPGAEETRGATWLDTLAHDSDFDYDPLWKRCEELGVAPTFHASGMGWGSRQSRSNYVYNHVGNFAAAGEASCRSIFFGGVPARFPELRFGFLEGGVAWAANLFSDILGHFEKRNRDAIRHYDPSELDRAMLARLLDEHAPKSHRESLDRLDDALFMLSDPDESPDAIDEFREAGVSSREDIKGVFEKRFYFGCEADDPMNAIAFDRAKIPMGARLNAIFASDIGHWDVPDFREVLPEAWELLEDGHLDEQDFRAFTCDNAIGLLAGGNPNFFAGTCVEDYASAARNSS